VFTKNIKDYFTDDLLNTVRGVLGEAKKCSEDCTCEKCESEKDEMTEGKRGLWDNIHAKRKRIKAGSGERMRKPGSKGAPTDDDFKAASEEVEQIDELSKKTLGSYVTKAARSATSNIAGAVASGMASGSSKEDQRDFARKYAKRMKGIDTAASKLTKEEQEFIDALNNDMFEEVQIDELSKATMGSYIKKASGAEKPKNVMSPKNIPLTKIAAYQSDSETGHFGKRFNQAGYDKADRLRKNRETGIKRAADKLAKEEVEQIAELSKKTLGSYVKKASGAAGTNPVAGKNIPLTRVHAYQSDSETGYFGKRFNQAGYDKADRLNKNRKQGITRAVDKLAKEEQDFIDALNADTLDEVSHDTVKSYLRATSRTAKSPADSEKRKRGAAMAVRRLEKEEVELEEGRGRPPKEGSAAWKARQGKADDDMVALGMQLRKAQSINKKVRFMDSKEHDIHPNHINRFNDHMAARRTSQEKAAFQKQAHKSHADFVKAVSAPVPKASKDTGEIVKYRH
jgi:hypothetical protein